MKGLILATVLIVVMLVGCTNAPAIPEPKSEPKPEPTSIPAPLLPEASLVEPVPEKKGSEPEPAWSSDIDVTIIPEPESELEPTDISEFLPTNKPTNPRTRIEYEHLDKMKSPLEAGFGVSEQCSLVGVYPGYCEKVPLLIRNGNDRERLFVIYVVSSTKPKEGFEALPEEYLFWLTVEEPKVELDRNEYCWINILIAIPEDSDYAGKHAEVRIRVDDITQTGLVQIALESKWYIITAE